MALTKLEVVAAPIMEKSNIVTEHEPDSVATHDDESHACPRVALSPLEYRKLIWKLDVHLLPPLFILWFVSLIDRLNIGSAKIFGIVKDLHMDPRGTDFNVAIITTMVGLILFDVPSNYLLKKLRPSWVLTAENLLLGIFTLCQGLVTNFAGLASLRFFVGALEAGLFPGSVYLLAQYYPRYELQWRVSMLMVSNALSNAFGGLFGFAIAGIKSDNGYSPWRWLFIIEGCMTAGAAILVFPFLPNWPSSAKWLTPEEKQVIADEIRRQGVVGRMDKLDWKTARRVLFDWKVWICGAMYCCSTVTVYSVSIFAPTIINQFQKGQSPRHVQALVIPIFVSALVACLAAAYASDKLRHRSGFVLFGYCLAVAGSVILMDQDWYNVHVKYAALFFMASGVHISLPMVWTMLVNNVSGAYKIGFAVGFEVSLGNFGGIASALVFQGRQAPAYADGYKTLTVMSCVAAALVILYSSLLYLENRARDAGKRDHRLSDEDVDNLGDEHPSFRYSY